MVDIDNSSPEETESDSSILDGEVGYSTFEYTLSADQKRVTALELAIKLAGTGDTTDRQRPATVVHAAEAFYAFLNDDSAPTPVEE